MMSPMSNITIFFIVFVFLLMIGGWITSEVISNKATKKNKKFRRQVSILEKENDQLQASLTDQIDRYTRIKEEYEKVKDAKTQIRALETDYKRLSNEFEKFNKGVEVLQQKVTSKKYSSNSLAKDLIIMIEELFPSQEKRLENKADDTRQTFKRIKSSIGMGE